MEMSQNQRQWQLIPALQPSGLPAGDSKAQASRIGVGEQLVGKQTPELGRMAQQPSTRRVAGSALFAEPTCLCL